jgi:hypothetical protein
MYKIFDYVMTKMGHKYASVDFFGNVNAYRYYFFYVEKVAAASWKEKYLPNLIVHHFVDEVEKGSILGETSHTHPWSTMSVVLKGGYVEETDYNEKNIKTHVAPAIVFRKWNQSHRFLSVKPGTWTLFFHGIRRGMWAFDLRVHDNICDYCEKNNGGVCFNEGKKNLLEFSKDKEIMNTSKESKGWRETSWIKCDENFEKMVEERKRSIERRNVTPVKYFNNVEVVQNLTKNT